MAKLLQTQSQTKPQPQDTLARSPVTPVTVDQLRQAGGQTGVTRGDGMAFHGTAADAANFFGPVRSQPLRNAQPANGASVAQQNLAGVPVAQEKSPLEISIENSDRMKSSPQGTTVAPKYLTREEGAAMGLGWKGRMAKFKEDTDAHNIAQSNAAALAREQLAQGGQTLRQGMANENAIATTTLRETSETGRNNATNLAALQRVQTGEQSAMDRLAKGHEFTLEQMGQKEKFDAAGDHRKAAAAALVAGAPGSQVNQMANANPGFPVDYSGVQVPLKNTQQDQFQFITKDNMAGQPQSVLVGNRQNGQIVEAPAVSALSSGAQQQQQPAAQAAGKQPAAADAYAKIYQSNPQRLQEDVAFATAQIGTVYKTDEEQLAYLNATRKTNPMLFQALKQQLVRQQAVAR